MHRLGKIAFKIDCDSDRGPCWRTSHVKRIDFKISPATSPVLIWKIDLLYLMYLNEKIDQNRGSFTLYTVLERSHLKSSSIVVM
jgi:hypothetical protein